MERLWCAADPAHLLLISMQRVETQTPKVAPSLLDDQDQKHWERERIKAVQNRELVCSCDFCKARLRLALRRGAR